MVSRHLPSTPRTAPAWLTALAVAAGFAPLAGQQALPDAPYRFRSGVELVNVTATVRDGSGRFVPGLTADDFLVYEDDVRQHISQFSADRVPVSLGIAVDASGSMAGEKIAAARSALDRFVYELLGPDDDYFLYRFNDRPTLLQEWTTDRRGAAGLFRRLAPSGGTAIYDTLMEAIPMARDGRHAKKALLLISDGNDTSSRAGAGDVKGLLRRSEVLLYAVGIDGDSAPVLRPRPIRPRRPAPPRAPFPPPFGPGGRRPWGLPALGPQGLGPVRPSAVPPGDDRVNVRALRDLTDDSGGRTEIVRRATDLGPATAGIADELSRQYYLGYVSTNPARDGRWRTIRVELRQRAYQVRARAGYVAN